MSSIDPDPHALSMGEAAETATAVTQPAPTSRGLSRFAVLYIVSWAGLAGLALFYLVTVAPRADGGGLVAAGSSAVEQQEAVRMTARHSAEIDALHASMKSLDAELVQLRAALAQSEARERALTSRLALVETRGDGTTQIAAEPSAPPSPPRASGIPGEKGVSPPVRIIASVPESRPTPFDPIETGSTREAADIAQAASRMSTARAPEAATEAKIEPPQRVIAAVPPRPAPAPAAPTAAKPAPKAPAAPIATGSLPAAPAGPVAFGPAVVKHAAPLGPSAVELSSAENLDALRASWAQMSERSAALQALEPRYRSVGQSGPYRLIAGPIANAKDATKLCADLKVLQITCRVSGFGGNAL